MKPTGAELGAAAGSNNYFTKSMTNDMTARPGKAANKPNRRLIAKS